MSIDRRHLSIRKPKINQDFLDIQNLHKTIWDLQDIDVHPVHMLIGIQESNGLVLCAYDRSQPVGFLLAYCGITEDQDVYLHCHNLAVLKSFRNSGIGLQLLSAIRKHMLRHKVRIARATFDPLESANANFYIGKAGCISKNYIRNFYGAMTDQFNKGVPSDRLMIEYRLVNRLFEVQSKKTQSNKRVKTLKISGNQVLNKISIDDNGFLIPEGTKFLPTSLNLSETKQVFIQIPSNYQEMRDKNSGLALKWRFVLRELLEKCFELGMFICGFISLEGGCYYILKFPDAL